MRSHSKQERACTWKYGAASLHPCVLQPHSQHPALFPNPTQAGTGYAEVWPWRPDWWEPSWGYEVRSAVGLLAAILCGPAGWLQASYGPSLLGLAGYNVQCTGCMLHPADRPVGAAGVVCCGPARLLTSCCDMHRPTRAGGL